MVLDEKPQDVLLRNTNVKLPVGPDEKSEDCQFEQGSSLKQYTCMYRITQQHIQMAAEAFSLVWNEQRAQIAFHEAGTLARLNLLNAFYD